ncbi:hypothetical protein VOLCADRAFT_91119 [Volvox carteri f. nagariensis]|uniref:Uncharacterized protein n=1 Tax=Volvox carteri f. nagariensis TaxID=3068 RepID=D8TW83_VOLCA|nr:uncharacterized protein VOLCADRAFT_91119 [Volvox carteri f. nagariensis]EFJ48329.1 hypothetical protein VOLCADRAFT_91119 [Volvox carteri f. nagariensis]|eukprot:XP_002950583.1 hypothetical protein VOLCADRAFT_91119 [Volvox carteri f. nagariensis]
MYDIRHQRTAAPTLTAAWVTKSKTTAKRVGLALLMVSEQRSPAPNGATVARILPGGNGRRTITRDYHRLINECTEKLLSNPKHTLAMRLRAQSYRMLGEDDAALADYNSLLALEPTNVDALFYRGTILERQQHIDEAIQCYTAVLQQEPQHHKALYNRAVCFSAKGSFSQAIEDFSAAIELDQQTCKGTRRLRDQDPAQQQLASSLGAAADAAAAAALHASTPQPHTLSQHVRQQYGAEGHGLSSRTSFSDVSGTGWERLNSNTGSDALFDEEGHTEGLAWGPGAGTGTGTVLSTARSHAGAQPDPHAATPEAGAASLSPKQHKRDLHHHPDQHGRSYRQQLRQRQRSSGLGEDAGAHAARQQEPSIHDSLGSWLEPRQGAGCSEAAWTQAADASKHHGSAATSSAAPLPPPSEGPASARLLATLQGTRALHLHQQAQRQEQQQQQQAEDEFVLEQLRNMFVAAQQHEQQSTLSRQGSQPLQQQQEQQQQAQHAAVENGTRAVPNGVLREVQGQGFSNNGRSQTPKGRVAAAAHRAGPAAAPHGQAQQARLHHHSRPPGPGPMRAVHPHVQAHRHVQMPGRSGAQSTPGSTPPGLARELRSPSPFERFVQDDRSPGVGAAAAASGQARNPGSQSWGGGSDRHSGAAPTALPPHLRPPPSMLPHQLQYQQQQQQLLQAHQAATAVRMSSAAQQQQNQQQQHAVNLRGTRAPRSDGGGGHQDALAEEQQPPQGNGYHPELVHRLQNGAHRDSLQVKGTAASPSSALVAYGSSEVGDGLAAMVAAARRSGGGDAGSGAPESTGPASNDGACSLDPWSMGGHGGMVAAVEMSRPSTSSSAASDATDQSSRHKAIEQYNLRAFALRQQGKLVEAVREYTRALELDSNHFKTLFNRGFTYDRGHGWLSRLPPLGELEAAVEDYTAALQVDPQSSYAHYNRGITRDRLQDFAGAVADFTAAICLEPNSADFYHNRGFALRKQGMFEAAVQDYTMAIKLNPNHCRAYYNRAFCHDRLNHVQQAIDDYTKALEMEPNNATALLNRGSLHERNGRSDMALQDFDRAIMGDPNCAQSYNARGVLLQHLGRLEEAQSDLDMAVVLMQPPSALLFRNRAQDLTRAISLDPGDLLSYSRRAHCFRRMGEYESAIRDYTRAITLSPNNPKLHTIRAYCYAMIEWYNEAVMDYDIVISLEPGNAHASYNRSIALEKLGGGGGAAAAVAPSDRLRQSVTAAAAVHVSNGRGHGHGAVMGAEQAVESYEFAASTGGATSAGLGNAGIVATVATAATAPGSSGGGVQWSGQGFPLPRQAWASMDGRYSLQQQQQQQAGPSGAPVARSSTGSAGPLRGPSPMRSGATARQDNVAMRTLSSFASAPTAVKCACVGGPSGPRKSVQKGFWLLPNRIPYSLARLT